MLRGTFMKQLEVNSVEDLFEVLDRLNEHVDWNSFYAERSMKAPFLLNNTLPDKVVTEFIKKHSIKTAVEFGCGEGRNTIYLAKNGIDVLAIDSSDIAIKNAKKNAESFQKNIKFAASDFLSVDYTNKTFDLAIDSGMFHHLAPHRRLQYRDLLKTVIKKDGFFILLCFAADAGGADEVDDMQFYLGRNTGTAFSEQRIRSFFSSDFEIISIDKCSQSITEEYIDIPFLYSCNMRRK